MTSPQWPRFSPPDPDSEASLRWPGHSITASRTWDGQIRIAIGPVNMEGAQWICLPPELAHSFINEIIHAIDGKRDE